jgi:hypothetical protein
VANRRTLPTSKRNLKPLPISASSAQPPFTTASILLQAMNQNIESGAFGAAQSPTSSKKRRASGQPGQVTPSPIAPAPPPPAQNPSFAEASGGPATVIESQPAAPPPAKRGRTNTPWTPAEEQLLKSMRDQGKSWSEIAKVGETCLASAEEG